MALFPASVRLRWASALLIAMAIAADARAQQPADEPPVGTISDDPALSPEESDRKARALFKQGKEAYEDGRYRDSWDYFRQAYMLSKRPELLYNVGQSADRLRMDREALEAFRLYLKRLPDAENRREVENRVRALEERLGPEAAANAPPPPEQDPAYVTAEGQDEAAIFGAEPAAGAEPGAETDAEADAEAQPEADAGSDAHAGWYARAALGFGVLSDSVSDLVDDATLSSGTSVAYLGVGYGFFEGIVLGGALMFDWSLGATISINDNDFEVETANLTLFGPFIDYYFAPGENGWHAFAALTLAWFSLSERGGVLGVEDASGGALVLGGGYDWPLISDEWTVGALGRLVLAKVDQETGKHALGTLSVSATLTWY